jgi:hypothetical protein
MIYLAKRLASQETDADKEEFIRGVANLNKHGELKALGSAAIGYMLANWLKNRG